MPVHDWTRADAGLFHAFHHGWIDSLGEALNSGILPTGFFALPEQRIRGPIPDVLTLKLGDGPNDGPEVGGVAVAEAPPKARVIRRSEAGIYADKADRLAVRHRHGEIIAVIEIVSPGNKTGKSDFRTFVEKSAELIRQGVHLLIIDLFPPGKRDPHGIHKAIWDEFVEEDFDVPSDKPLTIASYMAGTEKVAYVESVGVGDVLPEIPLFLSELRYVQAPLEISYQSAWSRFPKEVKGLLLSPTGNKT